MADYQDEKDLLRTFFSIKDNDLSLSVGEQYKSASVYTLNAMARMMLASSILSFMFSFPLKYVVNYIFGNHPQIESPIIAMLLVLALPTFLFLGLLFIAVILYRKVIDSSGNKINYWVWGFMLFNSFVICFFSLIFDLLVSKLFFIIAVICVISALVIRKLNWVPSLFSRWLIMLVISSLIYLIVYIIWPPQEIEYLFHIIFTLGFIYCINKNLSNLRSYSIAHYGVRNISHVSYKLAFLIYFGIYLIWMDIIQGISDN